MGDSDKKVTILLTGFGPFGNPHGEYTENPSWLAVDKVSLNLDRVNLVKQLIPVTYEAVDQTVPHLWKSLQPDLVIHCGVSHLAKGIVLEKQAHCWKYMGADAEGKHHCCDHVDSSKLDDKLCTTVDVHSICDQMNQKMDEEDDVPLPTAVSSNAGRYLCEYIFNKSLCENQDRTMFIHVPDLKTSPTEKVAKSLEVLITLVLKQLNLL